MSCCHSVRFRKRLLLLCYCQGVQELTGFSREGPRWHTANNLDVSQIADLSEPRGGSAHDALIRKLAIAGFLPPNATHGTSNIWASSMHFKWSIFIADAGNFSCFALPSTRTCRNSRYHSLRVVRAVVDLVAPISALAMARRADGNAGAVARVLISDVFGRDVAEQLQLVQPDLRRIM